jgi:DHA3 family tetracycline resistance protein-like MFS transporter
MQHSYEGLDRPAKLGRGNLLSPLKHRDFRILWMGMAVSLIGDGIFLIAIAWESYTLWNAPASLAIVGVAITVPMIVFLLVGGVISDRHDRRVVMVCADGLRATAVAILAVLALTGTLRFWELVALVAFYGIGTAFFTPAFEAMVPQLLPPADLPSANSLDQFMRPIGLRLVGPVVGGALVAVSSGVAFAIDAASFAASLAAVVAIAYRSGPRVDLPESNREALIEGLRFVRERVWLWGTLLSAAIAYLVFLGPAEVLLPYLVKNDLHASAGTLGLVLAAGGLGAVGAAIYMGQRGHPRRDITVMYATWTLATLAIVGYGIATAAWQLMLTCLVFNALEATGTIVWATIKQRHVPGAMLGRVSSLDWLISIALLPLSFALTAPVAAALGARTTLVYAGVIGAVVTLGAYFLPGMRSIESPSTQAPDESSTPSPHAPAASLH